MINLKQAIIRDFSKAAKNYDLHARMQRQAANSLFDLIKENLHGDLMVLDSGSGTGYFHELLRKNKIYCPLIQADIAFTMCQKAANYASSGQYGSTHTITADIESLPIANDQIDLSFSALTLQWTNLKLALGELHRTLKPAGKIAFSIVGHGSLHQLIYSFSQLDDLTHSNEFYNVSEVRTKMAEAGFKQVSIQTKTITEHYVNIYDLMHSIKGVGANYKKQKYLGKNYFSGLEQIYKKKFANENGLPLSWEIIYVTGVK